MSDSQFQRCVLITNGNLASMIALADWLRRYGDKIAKIYVTTRLPSAKGNISGLWTMLRQSGWEYTYMKVWINRLAPALLRRRGLPWSVKEYARRCRLGVPVTDTSSVNTDEVINEIKALRTELLVSFSATERFCDSLVQAPTIGAINVHYGPLPAYAGLSPYFWHLYNREQAFGVTLHRIVSKLDAGPIIEQVMEPIDRATSCLELLLKMAATVSPILDRFFRGQTSFANTREQNLALRSYFRHPTRSQVRQFHSAGYRMLDARSKRLVFQRVRELTGGAS